MIKIEGNKIIADTKTQIVVFVDGSLVEVYSKLDGKRYLQDTEKRAIPISLVYAFNRTLSLGKADECTIETFQYNDYMVNISFCGWYGHAEMMIEEEPETGAVCITPSAHTTRPGVFSCRWEFYGLDKNLTMTLPYLQGFQARLDDPILKWDMFKKLRYPYRWEENFVSFGDDKGGMWIYSEGSRNRYKLFHVGNDTTPFYASFDTQNYGPIEDKLSAGGVTWKLNTYEGDWTVPVLSYREILMKDPSWEKSKATMPDWFDDIKLTYSWCPTDGNVLDTLKKYIEPKNVLIHLPNWRIYEYDQHYPDYTASAEARAFIEKGNEMGFHIAPHFNCYEIDPSLPEFELVRDFRYRGVEEHEAMGWGYKQNPSGGVTIGVPEDGTALRTSRSRNVMTKIHPALPTWRNMLAENVKKAIDTNNLHVVFLDVSHNTHNLANALVNNTTTIEAAWDLLSMVQKINGGVTIGGEGMNETLLCQHFAQGHSMYNGPEEEMIPVQNYLPINKMLFGDLCHLIGYHPQKTFERRVMQDACDEKRGFLPTLMRGFIYDLEEKDSISRLVIEKAIG